jgi:hypothetical protein
MYRFCTYTQVHNLLFSTVSLLTPSPPSQPAPHAHAFLTLSSHRMYPFEIDTTALGRLIDNLTGSDGRCDLRYGSQGALPRHRCSFSHLRTSTTETCTIRSILTPSPFCPLAMPMSLPRTYVHTHSLTFLPSCYAHVTSSHLCPCPSDHLLPYSCCSLTLVLSRMHFAALSLPRPLTFMLLGTRSLIVLTATPIPLTISTSPRLNHLIRM